jgi:hypothetical protein
MTWEMLIIAAFRVLGSLPVLRWAFIGALIAMLADLGDLFLREAIDLGGVSGYQRFDKWLDQIYMLTFLVVALRWAAVPRNVAVTLYAYRMIGFIAFEIVGDREILLFFPNVFEYWVVFVAGLEFFRIEFRYSRAQLALIGSVLLAGKLFQEYALHHGQWFESFTAFEAVEAIWEFVTAPLQ